MASLLAGLDLETTGLDWLKGDRIIEIAVLVYSDDGKKLGGFVQRVNPQRPISAKAQQVHGISFEDLVMEPVWEAVAPKVHAVLSKCDAVVAHNGRGFDIPFLAHEFKNAGLDIPKCMHHDIDTMVDGRWATPLGKLPNLGELCFASGVEYDTKQAHGALYDVEVMMASYFAAKQWGYYPSRQAEALEAA